MAIAATVGTAMAGTGTATVLFFHANPVSGPICLGITAIIYSVFRVYKLFKFLKYGENKIPKNDFIKNLSIFAYNTGKEIDLEFNPFAEPSELTKIKTKINTVFPNTIEIDVNELCFTSVEKACPIGDTTSYDDKNTQNIAKELKKQQDKIKWWEGLRRLSQKISPLDEMKYRKRIVKGIIKRMGDVFNEISIANDKPEIVVSMDDTSSLVNNIRNNLNVKDKED